MDTYKLADLVTGAYGSGAAATFQEKLESIATGKHLTSFFLRVMQDHVGPRGDIFAAFNLTPETGREVRCSLTINGVEVSLTPFVMAFAEHFDRETREAALVLLREQCDGLTSAVETLTRRVDDAAREKLGVSWEE